MDPLPDGVVTAEQACEWLDVSPHTLRQVLREYADLFPGGVGGLDADGLRRLGLILRLRSEGADGAAIRAALLAGSERPPARVEPGATAADAPVWAAALERLERLERRLDELDRRRRDDRDRLLVGLARLHQEMRLLTAVATGARRGRRAPAGTTPDPEGLPR